MIHERLRAWVRVVQGRAIGSSEALVDSQSVKSAAMLHQAVGYDVGKQIKGCKRFMTVDTLGLVLRVLVSAASFGEWEGANKSSNESNGWVKECPVSTLFGLMAALMVHRS